jgi:hypothetical protein
MYSKHPPLVDAAIEAAYKATKYLAVISGRMNLGEVCRVALKAKSDLSSIRSPFRVQAEEEKKGLV